MAGLPDPNPFLPRSLELKEWKRCENPVEFEKRGAPVGQAQKVKISSKNAIVLPESKIDKVWQAFFRLFVWDLFAEDYVNQPGQDLNGSRSSISVIPPPTNNTAMSLNKTCLGK